VAIKTTRAISDADPGAEGERRALVEHNAGEVDRCDRVRLVIVNDYTYLAR
jgi:hypothetical protein